MSFRYTLCDFGLLAWGRLQNKEQLPSFYGSVTTGVTDSVSVLCVSWEKRLGDQFSLLTPETLSQNSCAVHSVYPLACTEYLCSDGTARSTETGRKAFLMFPSLQVINYSVRFNKNKVQDSSIICVWISIFSLCSLVWIPIATKKMHLLFQEKEHWFHFFLGLTTVINSSKKHKRFEMCSDDTNIFSKEVVPVVS